MTNKATPEFSFQTMESTYLVKINVSIGEYLKEIIVLVEAAGTNEAAKLAIESTSVGELEWINEKSAYDNNRELHYKVTSRAVVKGTDKLIINRYLRG